MKRIWRGEYPIAALFLALALIFLGRVTFGGKVLLPTDNLFSFPPWDAYAQEFSVDVPHNELMGDMILQNYSWKTFAKESIEEGQLPLWNPYIFSGMPFLAAGQYAVLYPLGFFFYIMPVAHAYGWFTALHLFLGGLFMYFFMRTIGVSRLGGLLSGIAFMFSGFLVVSFQWPMMVSTAIWLPFVMACAEKVIRGIEDPPGDGRTARWLFWTLAGALALGLQFLAGHMEISFYILFTLLFYSGARLGIIIWRKREATRVLGMGGALVLMVALGTGLAAVQLVPFYEVIKGNYRAGSATYQDVVGWAFPKRQVLAFLMPDFFGNPTHHSYFDVISGKVEPVAGAKDTAGQARSYPFWGTKNYVEGTSYVGILPILLAISALLGRRDKYTWIFGAYALFSLLLAFGTPLYALFFYGIPGLNQLHSPFRWVFPYSFSIIVLAGLGIQGLEEGERKRTFLVGGTAVIGSVLILLAISGSRLLPAFSVDLAQVALSRSTSLSSAFSSPQMLYSYQFRNFLLLALLLLAGGILMLRLGPPKADKGYLTSFSLLGLLVVDLFQFGYGYYSTTDPKLLEFTPKALDFLKEDYDLFRIATFGQKDVLKPNSGMIAGLQDIRGYDTIIPQGYVEFWRLMEEPSGLLYSQINRLATASALDSPLLSLMNAKYILTAEEINRPGYTLVYRGEVNIYRNEEALPRAFGVFDATVVGNRDEALAALSQPSFNPRHTVILEGSGPPITGTSYRPFLQPARVLSYQPSKVVIEIDMPQEGYLVLTDFYFSGWRARDERGENLPILKANHIFRAVALPQGQHLITFSYFPDSFRLGLLATLLAGATAVLGAAYWGWQRMFQGIGETSTALRVLKNSLTPMAAQMLSKMVDLGFTIFMLRILGPANYGSYAFAVVIIGYFSILTDFGLGTILTREVAKEPSLVNRYLSNTLLARISLCILSVPILSALLALYFWKFSLSSEAVIVSLLFMASLFPSSVSGAISSVFNAYEKMEYPAAIMVVTTLLRASLGIGALLLGWGIVGLGLVSVITGAATALIFYLILVRASFVPKLSVEINPSFSRELGVASAPLMINNLLSTVFFRVDIMLLQPMKGHQAVGYYSTAYKFVDGLNIIPSFFTLALFPIMSRYADTSREALLRAFRRAIKALLIVAMPITVGTTIIAPQLIILFFGQDYEPSIRALQILIWFLPLSYVNSVTQYVLIAVNQQRFLTLAFAIGATFNIVANLVAIPYFGFEGAAVTTILSEVVLMVPFLVAVRRHVGEIPLLELGVRPALASLFMGGAIFPLQHLSLLVIIPLSCLIYGAALLILRTFDEEDKAVVKAFLARP